MPKIFLIKNRLLQQQQRLLESQKQLAAVDINADDGDVSEESDPLPHRSTSSSFQIKNRFSYQSVGGSSNGPSPEPISDEPLSLVVHKG